MIINGSLPDGMVPEYVFPKYVFPCIEFQTADSMNQFFPKYGVPNGAFPDNVWPRVVIVGFFRDVDGTRFMLSDGSHYRLIVYEV